MNHFLKSLFNIALELRQRGHDVVLATHIEYQAKIEALGFEFQRMRPDNTALAAPQEMARMMDLETGSEYIINWVFASLHEKLTTYYSVPFPVAVCCVGVSKLGAIQ